MVRKNDMVNKKKRATQGEPPSVKGPDGTEETPYPGNGADAVEVGGDPIEDVEDLHGAAEDPPGQADEVGGAEDDPGGEPSEDSEPEGPVDPEESLKEELEILQDDLVRLQDQHLRLAADFENYRKRVSAELSSGWIRAQADLAGALLDGLDDLQRVSRFTSEDATLDTLIEGVDLVERKLLKALTDAGLEALDPTGEPFDPNTMEAVMRVPTEEDGQDETVHQVFQKGYLFKDQLVRPARVSVYKDDD
jgi:molecular chaperone GrpE